MYLVTLGRRVHLVIMGLLVLVLALAALAAVTSAQERPLPDQDTFFAEVRARLQTDGALQSRYRYIETRRDQKLDEHGRPVEESVKVFESHPGFPGEGRWERLLVEDGTPVPADELAEQDRARQQKAREAARRTANMSARDRARQRREWEEHRRERAETVEDVFRVYAIRMLGRERVGGHDTIAFALTPRSDADPRTDDGERLRHFKVRAWISETEYELVQLEAEAIDTVSIAFGLLARVHPGSRFGFTRRKVNGEAWLPAVSSYSGSARVGLVRVLRRRSSSEFSDYHRVSDGASAAADRSEAGTGDAVPAPRRPAPAAVR